MVCVPCFIIPVLLYIWHKFIQPIMLKYWNPWEKKDEQGNIIKAGPEFPFQCKGGVCPFPGAKKKDNAIENEDDCAKENNTDLKSKTAATTAESKKED